MTKEKKPQKEEISKEKIEESSKIKEDKTETKELTEQLQRLQAEFENYQKRTHKEKQELIKYAKEELLLKFLEIIDNFERAIKAIEKTQDIDQLKQGINLIFKQLEKTMKEEGIEAIEAMGKEFNPHHHEALAKEESEEPENIIIQEFQKGYKLKDKVIRPTKVKISGGKK